MQVIKMIIDSLIRNFLTKAFLGRTVSGVYGANTATIVQSGGPVCTMLCYRNPVNIGDFALRQGPLCNQFTEPTLRFWP